MEPKDSGGTKASVARARRQGPPPRAVGPVHAHPAGPWADGVMGPPGSVSFPDLPQLTVSGHLALQTHCFVFKELC